MTLSRGADTYCCLMRTEATLEINKAIYDSLCSEHNLEVTLDTTATSLQIQILGENICTATELFALIIILIVLIDDSLPFKWYCSLECATRH